MCYILFNLPTQRVCLENVLFHLMYQGATWWSVPYLYVAPVTRPRRRKWPMDRLSALCLSYLSRRTTNYERVGCRQYAVLTQFGTRITVAFASCILGKETSIKKPRERANASARLWRKELFQPSSTPIKSEYWHIFRNNVKPQIPIRHGSIRSRYTEVYECL